MRLTRMISALASAIATAGVFALPAPAEEATSIRPAPRPGELSTQTVAATCPAIVAWGDSLTAGNGSSGINAAYPARAAQALHCDTVMNLGIGGQTSPQIAARQGAVPVTLNLGAQPGANKPWPVDSMSVNIFGGAARGDNATPGYYEGRGAVLQSYGGRLWLWLDGTNTAPVPGSGTFIPESAVNYGQTAAWIWVGRNNRAHPDMIFSDVAAMTARLGQQRFLVLGVTSGSKDTAEQVATIRQLNQRLARTYPGHFVDVLAYLLTQGNGSAQDREDVRRGIVPKSLRSDPVHLNDRGYRIVGQLVAQCWLGNCPAPGN